MSNRIKIVCVVSARPNFMKAAPIVEAFRAYPEVELLLAHTGQHYDDGMSGIFFRELGLPRPDVNFGIGTGTRVEKVAETMKAFERFCLRENPDAAIVVGDVDGTLACGLAAAQLGLKLLHVEAGLRSFDRTMPEELNRTAVDALADLLFCSEKDAVDNLRREGIPDGRIFFVGNVMIDALVKSLPLARRLDAPKKYGLRPKEYATVTLHRPAAVDDPDALAGVVGALLEIQRETPLLFPVHPRAAARLDAFGLRAKLERAPNITLLEPLGYLEFLALNADAKLILTDSGGLQEEALALGVPCVTVRDNTERPVTCELGGNRLAGLTPDGILRAYRDALDAERTPPKLPELWDGRAAERIAQTAVERLRQLEKRA